MRNLKKRYHKEKDKFRKIIEVQQRAIILVRKEIKNDIKSEINKVEERVRDPEEKVSDFERKISNIEKNLLISMGEGNSLWSRRK